MLLVYGTCLTAVVGATVWRVSSARVAGARTAGTAATVLVTLLILGFVVLGPTKDGWARRAGTPAELLGGSGSNTGLALPLNNIRTFDESLASSGRSETVTMDRDPRRRRRQRAAHLAPGHAGLDGGMPMASISRSRRQPGIRQDDRNRRRRCRVQGRRPRDRGHLRVRPAHGREPRAARAARRLRRGRRASSRSTPPARCRT